MTTALHNAARESTAAPIFDRVVCGVGLGSAGRVAATEAAQLVGPEGSLLLVSATVGEPVAVASPAGLGYAHARTAIDGATRERYRDALTAAREATIGDFGGARVLRVEGEPLICLLDALERERATLAVIGTHQTGRVPGIVFGSVATHMLHKAPCSVLVARPGWPEGPARVIVGVDGSTRAVAALHAANDLAERFGIPLEELWDANPVQALLAAAGPGDLIVVGSRGLHGLRALGSVSERVAHQAPCSVLVVRPTRYEAHE